MAATVNNFGLTDTSLTIRFSDSTTVVELNEPVSPIPQERLRFHAYDSMYGLANINTHLPGWQAPQTTLIDGRWSKGSGCNQYQPPNCRLFLNATSGTHIYFDKETTAGETYFYRLVAQDTRLPSAAPLLKSYANVESLSIAELNEFIISASSQV
ncbi:hypothetical protein F2Q68_00011136 [Brassica cretica]|uniref:Uncharacterized protein n=1 Tax=Brassica cretica TaxID=69181 RepID=A0A8S9L141_BRACR|nr:hypothetical protein F2Q68_00011136 [Brassica cretica]